MSVDEMRLDGNAVGGLMREIFALEVTSAIGTCGSCGAVNEIGRVQVYIHAPGTVVRCPGCEAVLMKVVRGRGRYWIDMGGLRSLELAQQDSEEA